ncbi:MAG: hypothetical protein ACTSPB_01445 [Candidatus Thorarchaeota archaeon]
MGKRRSHSINYPSKRKRPIKHTVHTVHPRYQTPVYSRGSRIPTTPRETKAFTRNVKKFIRNSETNQITGLAKVEDVQKVFGKKAVRDIILSGEAYCPRPNFIKVTDSASNSIFGEDHDKVVKMAHESKTFNDFGRAFIKYFYDPSRSAKDVKIGEVIKFTPPKSAGGYYDRKPWYGSERLRQYNDSSVSGRVTKINPKSIKIVQDFEPDSWNYRHEYKVPKDARASRDLGKFLGKDEAWLKRTYNKYH